MSMDYPLALELKKAGFPQYNAYELEQAEKNGGINPDYTKLPTLSELIEACGEDFNGLQIHNGERDADRKWWAFGIGNVNAHADTPISAVARLWIQLNK